MYRVKRLSLIFCAAFALNAQAQSVAPVGAGTGPGTMYATDAFPGFDAEAETVERKEPRWFQFIFGPKMEESASQLEYCRALESDESWSKAIKEYDALVRNWPTSPEASVAQQRMAELLLEKEDDAEGAFEAYKYLVTFYTSRCEFNAIVDKMYEVAGKMRSDGKRIVFWRFKNPTEVRRAFEACVLLAPGATWAPTAMLTIGEIRTEELEYTQAVTVYENLRNLFYGTKESKESVSREAEARMELLRSYGYNRARCADTLNFLALATRLVETERIEKIEEYQREVKSSLEEADYRSACFYDSRMRTLENAIAAYEVFLRDYPDGKYAEAVRARLEQLKGIGTK